ncbi:MAG: hypothetical protein HY337_08275 [Gemmatimonadetes bacterium]|nr:hypothetical protein [Gemmatimonadota bacterium]
MSSEAVVKAWQVGATPIAALAGSVSALLCCALPSFLVFVGLGATVASVVASVPWLVALSRHKAWVFTGAGILIGGSWLYLHHLAPRLAVAGAACPPQVARFARRTWRLSVALYAVGVFVAFGLGPLLKALEP